MRHEAQAGSRRAVWSVVWSVLLIFGPAAASAQEEGAEGYVRVPTSHINVHKGPTTARPVLVLPSEGTILPVLGRQGEWFEVALSPELRETGIVMRWYENEERGWVHESTVELVDETGDP